MRSENKHNWFRLALIQHEAFKQSHTTNYLGFRIYLNLMLPSWTIEDSKCWMATRAITVNATSTFSITKLTKKSFSTISLYYRILERATPTYKIYHLFRTNKLPWRLSLFNITSGGNGHTKCLLLAACLVKTIYAPRKQNLMTMVFDKEW